MTIGSSIGLKPISGMNPKHSGLHMGTMVIYRWLTVRCTFFLPQWQIKLLSYFVRMHKKYSFLNFLVWQAGCRAAI